MSKSILSAILIGLAVAPSGMASATVIAASDHFEMVATDIHPVGAGAAGENLLAFTLVVANASDDPNWKPNAMDTNPYANGTELFSGGIFGNFHQEWLFGGAISTAYENTIVGVAPTEIDTHYLFRDDEVNYIRYAPREDVTVLSGEPPLGSPQFGPVTRFGTYLKGTFVDLATTADVWELAHIVMPAGLVEIDAMIAAGHPSTTDERVTGSAMIGLPGENFPPAVDAGGPYTMTGVHAQSLPGDGMVQFLGDASDADGTVDGLLWEIARQGQGNWLTLPNDADTLDPILTEYELRRMFGADLNRNDMFDVRLTATDNLGATGQDSTKLNFVPEPSTWLLLLLGSASLWFWRRQGVVGD